MLFSRTVGLFPVVLLAAMVNADETKNPLKRFENIVGHPDASLLAKKFCDCLLSGMSRKNCTLAVDENDNLPNLTKDFISYHEAFLALRSAGVEDCHVWLTEEHETGTPVSTSTEKIPMAPTSGTRHPFSPTVRPTQEIPSSCTTLVVMVTLLSVLVVVLATGMVTMGMYFRRYTERFSVKYDRNFEISLV